MSTDRAQLTLAHEIACLSGDSTAAAYLDAALSRLDLAEAHEDTFDARLRLANEATWRATQPGATDWQRAQAKIAWMRVMGWAP